jgi:hypothetical protein
LEPIKQNSSDSIDFSLEMLEQSLYSVGNHLNNLPPETHSNPEIHSDAALFAQFRREEFLSLYAQTLLTEVSLDQFETILCENKENALLVYAIVSAAKEMGETGIPFLVKMLEVPLAPLYNLFAISAIAGQIPERNFASYVLNFLVRTDLDKKEISGGLHILASLNFNIIDAAPAAHLLVKMSSHPDPDIQSKSKLILGELL